MKKLLVLMVCCLLLLSHAAAGSDFRFSPRPNKAHLVQWRTWGREALEEARTRDKLVLLSLSAVWCHWCHVMDETTYSDQAVIDFINEHFIPVRVDADMRPDIDSLYNQGGWPSMAILTPLGEVITGGTYIPADEMLRRLKKTADLFRNDRGRIMGRLADRKAVKEGPDRSEKEFATTYGKKDLAEIVKILAEAFDKQHGGFGEGPKFPNAESMDFLLARYAQTKDPAIGRMVTTTLDHMARGAIFDHVDGGFFRYATKPDWSGPHYEKMLEVNAGLVKNYANAALVFGRNDYKQVVRKSLRYVYGNLYDPESGAFFGSQDADEAYYLNKKRAGLKPPRVDKTSYADSSALMVSALTSAYAALGDTQYREVAAKGADHLLATLVDRNDGVYHYERDGTRHLAGLLSDNVLVGSALLDLYGLRGEERDLIAAKEIGRLLAGRFYDADAKRFRMTLAPPLAARNAPGVLMEVNDNLANYRAVRFLGRLLAVDESRERKKVRDEALAALGKTYQDFTPNAAAYGNALLWALEAPVEITIVAEGRRAREYLSAIREVYVPQKTVRILLIPEAKAQIKKLGYPLEQAAYLCAKKRCSKPITNPGSLKEELKRFLEQKGKENLN